jgi:hypothetical protein
VLWGVYIAGPGIVGWMLMSGAEHGVGRVQLVFETDVEAIEVAQAIQTTRPYHFVSARIYIDGDESRGHYAAHPDGVS